MTRFVSILLTLALGLSLSPAAKPKLPSAAPSLFDRLDPGVRIPGPRVRIGLSLRESGRVELAASKGELRLLDGTSGRELWPGRAEGTVLVVPEGGQAAEPERVYRVQIGSFRDERSARRLAERVAREHRVDADAAWQASRSVWRVRVGEADARDALEALASALRQGGFPDAWITSELRSRTPLGNLRLIDSRWDFHSPGTASVVAVAPRGARVQVGGRPYRGVVEVLIAPTGALVAVNELALEEYLRGVVPEELGPAAFPELEALKAQSVAARTYILGNLGQYRELGYDICDTPRCQVYGGAASEHPLSDRAVRETKGRILTHDGKPINAMYTSTCGGHTEDVAVVFPDMVAPYLRGVPSCPGPKVLERLEVRVRGRGLPEGSAAGPVEDPLLLARLVAHGLAPESAWDAAWRRQSATGSEISTWGRALAQRAGLADPGELPPKASRRTVWRWWGRAAGTPSGEDGLLRVDDAPVVLPLADREVLGDDLLLAAHLVSSGVVRPGVDGRLDPDGVPSRGEALGWFGRLADRLAVAELEAGTVQRSRRAGRLALRGRRLERNWPTAKARPRLLVETGGGWSLAPQSSLWPGDKVDYVSGADGTLRLLAVRSRRGLSDDRMSRRYRWTHIKSGQALTRSIGKVAPVGELLDLEVLERGVSGRVARLEATGTKGKAVIEGFRLRRALGLPETLFDMEKQHAADGTLSRVIFSGRGWGHGVGLCQHGAYGMALRGQRYDQILLHYYRGVRLVRVR